MLTFFLLIFLLFVRLLRPYFCMPFTFMVSLVLCHSAPSVLSIWFCFPSSSPVSRTICFCTLVLQRTLSDCLKPLLLLVKLSIFLELAMRQQKNKSSCCAACRLWRYSEKSWRLEAALSVMCRWMHRDDLQNLQLKPNPAQLLGTEKLMQDAVYSCIKGGGGWLNDKPPKITIRKCINRFFFELLNGYACAFFCLASSHLSPSASLWGPVAVVIYSIISVINLLLWRYLSFSPFSKY